MLLVASSAEHDPRNAQELPLTLAQASRRADHGIVPLRQTADKAVRVRFARRVEHLLFRAVGVAHAQVFAHGGAFEPRLLQDHAVILAQRPARDGADVLPVHRDGTAVHVVKAH